MEILRIIGLYKGTDLCRRRGAFANKLPSLRTPTNSLFYGDHYAPVTAYRVCLWTLHFANGLRAVQVVQNEFEGFCCYGYRTENPRRAQRQCNIYVTCQPLYLDDVRPFTCGKINVPPGNTKYLADRWGIGLHVMWYSSEFSQPKWNKNRGIGPVSYVTLRNLVSMFTLDFINFRCLSRLADNVIFVDILVFCRIEQF